MIVLLKASLHAMKGTIGGHIGEGGGQVLEVLIILPAQKVYLLSLFKPTVYCRFVFTL